MNSSAPKVHHLESKLAVMLHYGTWIATAVIGLGLLLSNLHVVTTGIGLFILLPILRVILMLIIFARERDYRFVVIAAIVLVIILAGLAVGASER